MQRASLRSLQTGLAPHQHSGSGLVTSKGKAVLTFCGGPSVAEGVRAETARREPTWTAATSPEETRGNSSSCWRLEVKPLISGLAPSMSAQSKLRDAVSRYQDAKKSLHSASSRRSRLGLDWMNFFVADVQTGFGTYVAFYLAQGGWSESNVGLVLTVGGFAGVLSQIPGGALSDALTWKRGLVALGIAMIGSAALILSWSRAFIPVLCAELLHGVTAGIITPAIGAISLGLVGRRAMSMRTGRNYRFAAAGHVLTAALMGLAGAYYSGSAMFISAAALCIPAFVALGFIRPDEIDYSRARNAATDKNEPARDVARARDLAKNKPLVLFAASLTLFQLADASTLPLIGEKIATTRGHEAISISILIIIPQVVVAIVSPWVGYHSEKKGRRPLLLIGFALEPVRAGLLALTRLRTHKT